MSSFSAAQMPQNFRPASAVPAQIIAQAASALAADPGPTYLKIWVLDPQTGEQQVLSFGRWNPDQGFPHIQPPAAVATVMFEIYNATGSQTGQWSL